MLRRITVYLLAMLTVCVCSLSATKMQRGIYLRDVDRGFAIWIPAGYTKAAPRSERTIAYYTGGTHAAYAIEVLEPTEQSLADLLAARLRSAKEEFPDGKVEVIRKVDAGGRTAVLVVYSKLDGNEKFKGAEFVLALIPLADKSTLPITLFTRTGGHGATTALGRWMLGTMSDPRESALNRTLGGRRIHLGTGLSYRPPRGLTALSAADGQAVYAGQDTVADIRLDLSRVNGEKLEDALTADTGSPDKNEHVWSLAHPLGYAVRGTFQSSGKLGSARVVFRLEGRADLSFLVRVTGATEHRERMLRMAELVALEALYVDVKDAATRAGSAITGLTRALKRRKSDEVAAHVRTLCEVAYIDRAAVCLADNLAKLGQSELQIAVCNALSVRELPTISPALLKAAKNSKIKMNPPVLAKVLEALGHARNKKVVNFLLSHATRGDNVVSAAAIRALGHYVEQRERVARRLVKLMSRAEAGARRADYAARERWDVVRPAFQEALANLAGQTFRTADEAKIWLQRNRF